MTEFVTILIIVIAIILIVRAVTVAAGAARRASGEGSGGRRGYGRTNAFAPWPADEVPASLGVPSGHPARPAAERLESALGPDIESRVKDRVLREHPNVSEREWNWTWFELKRYFLMCGVLRGVPMYSGQADAAWHEFLMFTREYEQFCTRFCGEMIHHAPHAPGAQPHPDERAWFDWVYAELFAQAPASGRLWGAFFRTRLSPQKLEELESLGREALRSQWFNVKAAAKYSDLSDTADYLIDRAKKQLAAAHRGDKDFGGTRRPVDGGGYDPALGTAGLLSGVLIFHSIASPDDFARQMDQEQNEEERKANGSGDSTYVCSASSDDGRDNAGGHDGGGSGGDSSGGGDGGGGGGSSCGSSCGGGGGCGS
ncbi:glycine-rich domain-containing protein [Paenibacillus arenilitoris]|uniref:Uncharacterized protein n=1 Tax=Paenibacillus arenilitoris TaxID=2772299 RepID=A0A927CHS3_9BACL|nr:hypothetical protein [Paenibacillus arenilitoris]MBD2868334.1 hypothetical protein [Paenibacillus arenilitoris]